MKIIKIMAFLLLTHVPYGQTMGQMPKDTGMAQFFSGGGNCSISFISGGVIHGGVFINGQQIPDVPLGEIKQEDKSDLLTSAVTGIQLSGFGNVFLNQGEQESLIVEANENILPHIITNIRRGILTLGVSGSFFGRITLNFHLTLRNLRQIIISGAGDVAIQNDFRTPELMVNVSGSGNVRINNLIATDFHAAISGSGDIAVKGTTNNQHVSISGSGDYKGNEFNAENSTLSISGSGDAAITSKKVRYSITGSGELSVNGKHIEREW